MGPGGYKTQSIHTKNKSPYPNGMILVRNASQCLNTEGKSREEGWSTGKLVLIQQQPSQFRQLAQFSRDGTWDIQNPVKTYKKQVTLSYWYDLTEERKLCLNIEGRSGEEGWIPVSLFTNKISSFKFANWPNSAGMGPKVYKTQSKHTKKQVTLSYWCERALGKQAYCFILNASQRKKGWSTGKLVFGQIHTLQIRQLAQFSRDGTWVYKTQSKHTKNKSAYPTGMKGHKESKPITSYWMQVRGKRNGVPVSSGNERMITGKLVIW